MGDVKSELMPEGEGLRNALRWLSAERLANPQSSRRKLLDEAGMRFDLTPAEAEFLEQNWKE
jgi:hypothetical protein